MTHTTSKLRQQAELAFAKAQSQFLASDKASSDNSLNKQITLTRDDKTARLRQARLAKERQDNHVGGARPRLLK
jgi:hypothetical protein